MATREKVLIFICVAIMVLGQLIFKQVAINLTKAKFLMSWPVLGLGAAGIAIYGLSTVIWISVLQTVPISKAYPFFAMGFVLIPIAGAIFFEETIGSIQIMGIALIVSGIVCIGLAR